MLLMVVGIGLVGVITATLASFFIEEKKDAEIAQVQERLDRIESLLLARSSGSTQPDEQTEAVRYTTQ